MERAWFKPTVRKICKLVINLYLSIFRSAKLWQNDPLTQQLAKIGMCFIVKHIRNLLWYILNLTLGTFLPFGWVNSVISNQWEKGSYSWSVYYRTPNWCTWPMLWENILKTGFVLKTSSLSPDMKWVCPVFSLSSTAGETLWKWCCCQYQFHVLTQLLPKCTLFPIHTHWIWLSSYLK